MSRTVCEHFNPVDQPCDQCSPETRQTLENELAEQARANGMGSEREARLMAVNAELVEVLQLALSSHGVMLMSDPPQDAWKARSVEAKARAALAKAGAGK